MGEKPATHRHSHAQNQKLVPDDERRQDHKSESPDGDGRAGRDAADEQLHRRIEDVPISYYLI